MRIYWKKYLWEGRVAKILVPGPSYECLFRCLQSVLVMSVASRGQPYKSLIFIASTLNPKQAHDTLLQPQHLRLILMVNTFNNPGAKSKMFRNNKMFKGPRNRVGPSGGSHGKSFSVKKSNICIGREGGFESLLSLAINKLKLRVKMPNQLLFSF